ncbi:A cutinase-like protein from cryptococcus Sp [Lophiotrema nucula]|uniref:A cutinase-like protein from cryptococcus Sp n=1 Tax=Lophiotrema nucula TaxID=690887 RepID=A0A6A5Z8W0_9PLEO|nr:A cutinase-like protein from cryptococcus Sp [Lophiotrema nucula]
MNFYLFLPIILTLTNAAPVDRRATSTTCPTYTIINTRGTAEPQGQSSGFRTMNSQLTSTLSGANVYNTVYPAGIDQNSTQGTQDIINKITSTLLDSPDECFILEGYSQGAAATLNAMPQLTGASFDAVKGVLFIGNPNHKSGLVCNVDNNGGTTTRDVNGATVATGQTVPENWISKTLDVCIFGDGVCDTAHGIGINLQHLQYPTDTPTQNLGTEFILKQLGG